MSRLHKLRDDLDDARTYDLSPPPAVDTGSVLAVVGEQVRHIAQDGAPDGYVLTIDSASPGNLAWLPGGGGGGGGGGAPTNATYLTLSGNGTLSNERVFTVTSAGALVFTDNGANSTAVLTASADVEALSAVASTGIRVRTGSPGETTRTIAVTGGLTGSNLSGVGGNPTIDGSGKAPVHVVQTFNATTSNAMQQWVRPTGHTMMMVEYLGGGGGGGQGGCSNVAANRGGGGGGAEGGRFRWVGPALWPTLEVIVGLGGSGGSGAAANAAGTAGGSGERSFVIIDAALGNVPENRLGSSGDGVAGGGGGGTVAGTGGAGGTAASSLTLIGAGDFLSYGTGTPVANLPGQAGTNGASPIAAPAAQSYTSPGAGGGGMTAGGAGAGGFRTARGHVPAIAGGAAGGGVGGNGFTGTAPEVYSGGGGGGANTAGNGGKGGDAALGSGGGGGGAGVPFGGVGGHGGHGRVRITSW